MSKAISTKILICVLVLTSAVFAIDANTIYERVNQFRADEQFESAGNLLDSVITSDNKFSTDASLCYDCACMYALAFKSELAFKYLDLSANNGFYYLDLFLDDSDLVSLHDDSRFVDVEKAIRRNIDYIINALPDSHEQSNLIMLPKPNLDGDISLEKALNVRRSVRSFKADALTKQQLSQILWSAYGITYPIENAPAFLRGGFKTAPSAGGLYPLEIYVVCENIDSIPVGVFKYMPENHSLIPIKEGNFREQVFRAGYGQTMINEAPLVLVYSAIYSRTSDKYGKRADERYVCMDLGHSAQNVYLQVTTMGLATCAIGAFVDIDLKKAINMTREETPLYIMPVGKIQQK